MNLDRLKALIRLANNNPNEHEANLAARKVCKVIAENNFNLLQPQVKTAAGKVNEAKTWNDVKRSTEPGFRSRPTAPSPDDWENFMRNMGFKRAGFDWSKAPHVDAPEDNSYDRETNFKYKPDPPKRDPKKDFDWINGKRSRPQEMRKCAKCGLETMTFRTDENPWICNPCHWKDKT